MRRKPEIQGAEGPPGRLPDRSAVEPWDRGATREAGRGRAPEQAAGGEGRARTVRRRAGGGRRRGAPRVSA
ncbi:hypothetical protein SAM23877_6778 [Streptomyces ambofaciens ATCC 23877]|uniref:Uncharacterized protein n=1 Tax=Streptomyces ambofaciens (strain ATCC 23877 / 3486 / DSM 40053 / JCM 4204 / NBRC 12836 / NRRL B-2516) TaxID=278992 RepID=A0A0K2B3M8_STRA7|nr:hypothetical protein SAM23877_6778 [Streptomyces ambofaciens ATCC 23877]